jgi:hypothetical protein
VLSVALCDAMKNGMKKHWNKSVSHGDTKGAKK